MQPDDEPTADVEIAWKSNFMRCRVPCRHLHQIHIATGSLHSLSALRILTNEGGDDLNDLFLLTAWEPSILLQKPCAPCRWAPSCGRV